MVGWITLIIIALGGSWWWTRVYRELVRGRRQVRHAWTQVERQLTLLNEPIAEWIELTGNCVQASSLRVELEALQTNAPEAADIDQQVSKADQRQQLLHEWYRVVAESDPGVIGQSEFKQKWRRVLAAQFRVGLAGQFYTAQAQVYNAQLSHLPGKVIARVSRLAPAAGAEIEWPVEPGTWSGVAPVSA